MTSIGGASDFNGWGNGIANTRYARDGGITAEDLAGLELKWAFGYANAYAVDAHTGALIWVTEVDEHPSAAITGPLTVRRSRLCADAGAQRRGQRRPQQLPLLYVSWPPRFSGHRHR